MIKYYLILFLIIIIIPITNARQLSSRQLDSLYYRVVKIRMPGLLRNQIQTFAADTIHIKSATGLLNAVRMNLKYFNKRQLNFCKRNRNYRACNYYTKGSND